MYYFIKVKINTILKIEPKTPTITSKSKFNYSILVISNIVDGFKLLFKDADIIVKLQKQIKLQIDNQVNILHALFKHHKICNNDMIYSMIQLMINQKYFYSYKRFKDFV